MNEARSFQAVINCAAYLRCLKALQTRGVTEVTAAELAKAAQEELQTVREDLQDIIGSDEPYQVAMLSTCIRHYLGYDDVCTDVYKRQLDLCIFIHSSSETALPKQMISRKRSSGGAEFIAHRCGFFILNGRKEDLTMTKFTKRTAAVLTASLMPVSYTHLKCPAYRRSTASPGLPP